VFSYRMERVSGGLIYWTDFMTRWRVGWTAGSENKAHGKMASPFNSRTSARPTTIRWSFRRRRRSYWCSRALSMVRTFPAKQRDGPSTSTYEASRCWWLENDEQCAMDSRACIRAAATFVRGGTLPLCRTQSVRSDTWRNQGVCGTDNDGEECQGLCAELFALCR
jgi:hypothetical protein